jgi:hypothetical protein
MYEEGSMKRSSIPAALPLLLFFTASATSASEISLSGGLNVTEWDGMSGRISGQIQYGRELTDNLSLRMGAGYQSFGWQPSIMPTCYTCEWEQERSADIIPVTAGMRFDFLARSERSAAPFLQVSPALFLMRLSSVRRTYSESEGPSTVENSWTGVEPGFQVQTGIRIPIFSNGSAVTLGMQYLHGASPAPVNSGGYWLADDGWNWTNSRFNGIESLNALGIFAGIELP